MSRTQRSSVDWSSATCLRRDAGADCNQLHLAAADELQVWQAPARERFQDELPSVPKLPGPDRPVTKHKHREGRKGETHKTSHTYTTAENCQTVTISVSHIVVEACSSFKSCFKIIEVWTFISWRDLIQFSWGLIAPCQSANLFDWAIATPWFFFFFFFFTIFSHSVADSPVCLGLLSCCVKELYVSCSCLIDGLTFDSGILWHIEELMVIGGFGCKQTKSWSLHHHTWSVCAWYTVFDFLQTWCCASWHICPDISTLVSPVQRTLL